MRPGHRETTNGGARERLSREMIVRGALALADAEGLEAVTIRRLAQEHGVTPMALYRHFREKEDLIDAVVDRLLRDVRLPVPVEVGRCRDIARHPECYRLVPQGGLLQKPGVVRRTAHTNVRTPVAVEVERDALVAAS